MKKGMLIKILILILIWQFFSLISTMASHEFGFESGFLETFLLFIIFYIFGKRNQLTLRYFKPCTNLKSRLPEVFASFGWVKLMYAILLCILVIPFLFLDTLPTLAGSNVTPSTDFKSLLISFSLTGIIAPIVEEFVFRGVIFDLTRSYSRRVAMSFNVLLFAVLHLNVLAIINALLGGIANYELREKHNDIHSCIMLHILINCLALLGANGFSWIFNIVAVIAIGYYILRIIKWKKSSDKSENSKKNVCVKY